VPTRRKFRKGRASQTGLPKQGNSTTKAMLMYTQVLMKKMNIAIAAFTVATLQ
jgi:hypothetical protein